MDRPPAAAHAAHDESLIARLYGGDVDPAERARAVELMAACGDCASLFADLGAIAAAMAALPVPSRPRDFSLTEKDAARLGRRNRRWPALFRPGLRRSLGGALSALGLAGLILAGTASLLGGMVATSAAATADVHQDSLAAAAAGSATTEAPFAATTEGSVSVGAGPASSEPAAEPPASNSATQSTGGSDNSTRAGGTAAPVDLASPGAGPAFGGNSPETKSPGGGAGTEQRPIPTEVAANGIDARMVWLGGFGLLFAIGLALLLLPLLLRRGSREG